MEASTLDQLKFFILIGYQLEWSSAFHYTREYFGMTLSAVQVSRSCTSLLVRHKLSTIPIDQAYQDINMVQTDNR